MVNNFDYKINSKSKNNSTKSQRQLRVGEELRHLISNALLRESFYDQIIDNNTITIKRIIEWTQVLFYFLKKSKKQIKK